MTLFPRLLRLWLGACLHSTRWQVSGSPRALETLTTANQGTVVAFWHRSLTLSPALWFWARTLEPRLALRVLISRNPDGMLIADVVRPWGIIGIHGSSSKKGKNKGGAAVLRTALKELESGSLVGITPDGPRGPAEQVQPGAVALSRLARCAVVPVGMASTSLRLPSWDGLAFPLPFGRGALIMGEPLFQPDATTLQSALNDVSRRAESVVRHRQSNLADRLWRVAGTLLAPALTVMLRIRLHRGRELPGRLRERMGLGSGRRPTGQLLWIHAASVGETLCALPLADALLNARPEMRILFTTATVTGSEIVGRHPLYGQRIIHRFIPHDVPRWLRRFLNLWQPEGAIFVESELWPGIIAACSRRDIPVMLVNGRLSDRSARRWDRLPGPAQRMMKRLTWVAARGPEDAARFRRLGASPVYEDGDLKQDAPPLPYDESEYARLKTLIGKRPVFVAASTHPGEEERVLEAAENARRLQPDLLTILVPRHPARGAELATRFGLPRRSMDQDPTPQTAVWLADTLGELGLFYRLADRCFLGNSLAGKGGGHNPFEPLRLGVPTATGPRMENWREAMAAVSDTIRIVNDVEDLTRWLESPLPPVRAAGLQRSVVSVLRDRILETVER
ncbi:glycosyltransferase N-terminal domain-containing protein [Gluconobacter sp.]|uniref:glycosyltransferase N-terminal domain-containing protein n=1 Tax=Gluconobacter sp. TaxID=1876758 RepID=UPI0039EC76C1